MIELQTTVDNLGAQLVACTDGCVGIYQDQRTGVLPRGFYLERPSARGRGCLVVGLNPGKSKPREREFYRESGPTYHSVKSYFFSSKVSEFAYFTRMRGVIDQLGLVGPILWSNLAKCETAKEHEGLPPIQTMRHCAGRFLSQELGAASHDWPILALGREAFRTLAYLAPQRAVIGIPHPTGGFRDFRKMLENGLLRNELKERAAVALSATEPGVVWLGSTKERV